MALSKTVIDSLDDAKAALRNALAYAARTEHPMVCESIAKILSSIDTIEASACLMDALDNVKSKKEDGENPFGKLDF